MNKPVNKLSISVVITAYNEAEKIEECLKSVYFADEVILINCSSTDNTVEIAKKYTKQIITRPNNLMLNSNKNFGFIKAKNDWILSLDADERITPELRDEIYSQFPSDRQEQSPNGYWIPRKNVIFGKWIQNSIWWPDYQLRLFRKGKGKFAEVDVHEMLTIDGETKKFKNPMLHFNYETISQYIYKMDKIYTENAVNNILESDKKIEWFEAIRMPVSDFLKTFFMQKGYRDGLHGLVLSILQSFYSFIIFAKLWEKKGFQGYDSDSFLNDVVKEFKKTSGEFRYWILTSMIDNTRNNSEKVYLKFKRKYLNRLVNKNK